MKYQIIEKVNFKELKEIKELYISYCKISHINMFENSKFKVII